jgi:hypothetical protein
MNNIVANKVAIIRNCLKQLRKSTQMMLASKE